MSEFLEKFKDFCGKLGGRAEERRYPDLETTVVSCYLPATRNIGVLLQDNTVKLYGGGRGAPEIESRVRAKIRLSAREPKHAIFSKEAAREGLHVVGYFDQVRVEYDEKRNQLEISLWERLIK